MNWALLLGETEFELGVFVIDPGVDSGRVLASRKFPITDYDDIASLYQKSVTLTSSLLADLIHEWESSLAQAQEQNDAEALYLPQRRPEDGLIDWSQPASHVRRQVAALTKPYPGARSKWMDADGELHEIVVWRAAPAGDLPWLGSVEPGTIVHRGVGGNLIVRVRDGYICVATDEEASTASLPPLGAQLISQEFAQTLRAVVERHRLRYPEQPLDSTLLQQAGFGQ